MLAIRDNIDLSLSAIRAHKLRASLTILGLTMGVATVITVMTLIQGANIYVEDKIANLGTNVFQIARLPFAATSFNTVIKAMRNKHLTLEDMRAVAERCPHCEYVGATINIATHTRYRDRHLQNTRLIGHTANMIDIDTRTVENGRYFTPVEDTRSAMVCVIGATLVEELFPGVDPVGRVIRADNNELTVVGTYEKVGTVLGQDMDNLIVIPMGVHQKIRGSRYSLKLQIKASGGEQIFERAQDEARLTLRVRRHITGDEEEDFFIGTASSYIALWESISSAFFAVFVMVSSISAVVGGIVIMNVMLVSVTERTKEIGIRRAVGATESDILHQFLTEAVIQCIVGGAIGIAAGFSCALALRAFTDFPVSVETWVAALGLVLSSAIGLFFGIYPATRAAKLDPVVSLRSE